MVKTYIFLAGAIFGYIFFKQTLAWQAIFGLFFNCRWSDSGK
jgi:hypothetical protein